MNIQLASILSALCLAACLVGCQSVPPPVKHWGTIHEAMGQGKTHARVDLSEVETAGWWGVGALEDLAGEVTIVDGRVWLSKVEDGALRSTWGPSTGSKATLLFASRVGAWRRFAVDRDLTGDDIAVFVADRAGQCGLDPAQPFAFRFEGTLRDVKMHVIAGECPVRARMLGVELKTPPFRAAHATIEARLVGIFAADGGGRSAHHGRKTHMHVLIAGAGTGHVDAVSIAKGATLFLPAR
jgi:Alpha-acetolactate decarboxylase